MREWTEKHIIELIKKHSGGGVVTPFYTDITCYAFAYENGFITFSDIYNIKEISPVAKKILHLDDAQWRSSRILKSTIDSDWDTSKNNSITVESNAYAVKVSEDPFRFRFFLVPSPNTDSNYYNTYTQFKVHIDSPAISLSENSPFLNFPFFSFSNQFENQPEYSITADAVISDLNSVLKNEIEEDIFATYKNIEKDSTIENGKFSYGNWEYTYKPTFPESYILKTGFLKYFELFNSNDIYIEILNNNVIVRPDEIAQDERIFYGSEIKEAYENPD